MVSAGRIACIFTPMALTIASFVCLILIEISGWGKGTLGSYYFMKANFTDLSVSSGSTLDNTTTLSLALSEVKDQIADVYEIHLWNYCTSDSSNGTVDNCSKRQAQFVFDPLDVWKLNSTSAVPTSTSSSNNAIQSEANQLEGNAEELENSLLGKSGKEALDAYKKVAKVMFILFAVSFWTTLATIVLGIFAIFSRWGSFCTWIFASVSSIVGAAAAITSTALYGALVGTLKGVLDPYNVHVSLGTHALVVIWLSVVFSWAATLFWLFSVCCCSGRNNPHHRSNKGGLMAAEPKGMGYGDYNGGGRGMRVEKTGGGYERVASPFLGHAENEHGDRVPLNDYPQQTGYAQAGGYEPFRHS